MIYKLSDDTWDQKELKAVERVMKSGFYSMGKEVLAYEKAFAEKFGCKYAVMSNSGSSANLLAIASLYYSRRLKSGDEVIVPAVSWSTTYFPLMQHQLKLKFVDVDKQTLNISVDQLKKAITDKTKAIFCVNLLGNPNEFEVISQICEEKNILLLEDNCESLGGSYKEKYLGTFGLIGTFSTFYSHHLCTMEGGITLTNDEELYHYMLCIRAHGWTRNLPLDSKIYQKGEDEFYESFHFIMPGYNLRPLEIEAAIGIEQLNKVDAILEQRRENAKYFIKAMSVLSKFNIQREIGDSSWFGFAILTKEESMLKRAEVVHRLKQKGIEVRPIVAGNFTRNEAINYMNFEIFEKLTNADYIHENGFFVGNHSKENYELIDYLVDSLKEFESFEIK